jgi:predicted MFS family arabinose efflux permease
VDGEIPAGSTLQLVRFYLPAVAVMALLGARLLVRVPRTAALACVIALFALGGWNFADSHTFTIVGPAVTARCLAGRPPQVAG